MSPVDAIDSRLVDSGLLLIRVILGLVFAATIGCLLRD